MSDPYLEWKVTLARLKGELWQCCGVCERALVQGANGLCDKCEALAEQILCGDPHE